MLNPFQSVLDALMAEVVAIRAKLLLWAAPLAASGFFAPNALAQIKTGRSRKDTASEVLSLVSLYEKAWEQVRGVCAVTRQDLQQGMAIATKAFTLVSEREQGVGVRTGPSVNVRQAWTRLDQAYGQCRRALAYLRYEQGDADQIAPSLRRNAGPKRKKG